MLYNVLDHWCRWVPRWVAGAFLFEPPYHVYARPCTDEDIGY